MQNACLRNNTGSRSHTRTTTAAPPVATTEAAASDTTDDPEQPGSMPNVNNTGDHGSSFSSSSNSGDSSSSFFNPSNPFIDGSDSLSNSDSNPFAEDVNTNPFSDVSGFQGESRDVLANMENSAYYEPPVSDKYSVDYGKAKTFRTMLGNLNMLVTRSFLAQNSHSLCVYCKVK